ncbi:MAG: hypothetical protein ABI162_05365 [Luteolibacter sp.]
MISNSSSLKVSVPAVEHDAHEFHQFVLGHYKTRRPASNVGQALGTPSTSGRRSSTASAREFWKSTPTSSRT